MKREKGITLISLVITIIILMILASITIYTGVSTIKSSKFIKFGTELEIMQAQVNLLYEKYEAVSDEEKEQYLNLGEELTGSGEENKSFEGAGETDKSGYRYYTKETLESIDADGLECEYLVNVKERKVIALGGFEYERIQYYTLSQIKGETAKVGEIERTEVKVDNITYERTKTGYKITLENIQCSKYVGKYDVKCTNLNSENYITVGQEEIGEDFTFEMTREKTANAPKLTTGMIPIKYDTSSQKWVICSESDPEWYCYEHNTYKIKIIDAAGKEYETTLEIKPNEWANIMLCDGKYNTTTATIGTQVAEADLGSMFVWIPRYAYKITSGYHSTSGSIDVKFLSGTSYNYTGEGGTAKRGSDTGVITTSGYTDYIVHPCFTNGNLTGFQYGEWDKEIEGIWMAKFQAGIYTTTADSKTDKKESVTGLNYPIFKGRKYAYNYVDLSDGYYLSQALDDSGNPYGLGTDANSHLIKNSEWGSVAYLSISKYGYSGGIADTSTEKKSNNVGINGSITNKNGKSVTGITGYSESVTRSSENLINVASNSVELADIINNSSYAWNYTDSNSTTGKGTKSSTTGNIYGIFDMGGCLGEYVTSYIKGGRVYNENDSEILTGISNKLITAYPSTTCADRYDVTCAYDGWNKLFGEGIWETSISVGEGKTWFRPKYY